MITYGKGRGNFKMECSTGAVTFWLNVQDKDPLTCGSPEYYES
jgi:hypothetical protein